MVISFCIMDPSKWFIQLYTCIHTSWVNQFLSRTSQNRVFHQNSGSDTLTSLNWILLARGFGLVARYRLHHTGKMAKQLHFSIPILSHFLQSEFITPMCYVDLNLSMGSNESKIKAIIINSYCPNFVALILLCIFHDITCSDPDSWCSCHDITAYDVMTLIYRQ